MSIRDARTYVCTLQARLNAIQHPSDGWTWNYDYDRDRLAFRATLHSPEQLRQHTPFGQYVSTYYERNWPESDEFAAVAMGVIIRSKSDRYSCYFRPEVHAFLQECGSTNDLDDAKWMVAEAIRCAIAEAERTRATDKP